MINKTIVIERMLKLMIKEAKNKNRLVKGLKESIKIIIRNKAGFCILANHAKWKKYRTTIVYLSKIHKIPLIIIWSRKLLGRLTGLLRRRKTIKKKYKILSCSTCVILKSKKLYFLRCINKLINKLS